MRVLWLLVLACAGLAWGASRYAVVVNPHSAVSHLSRETIAALYLDKRRTLDGRRAVLLNLPFDHPVRRSFERHVLRIGREALEHYWLKAHFRGHRPPKVLKSERSVALFVKKVPGAVGYMHRALAEKEGLKVVYEWEE